MKVQDGKFKLQDLMVIPMQRVLKYHLLLKVCFIRHQSPIIKGLYRISLSASFLILTSQILPVVSSVALYCTFEVALDLVGSE